MLGSIRELIIRENKWHYKDFLKKEKVTRIRFELIWITP
jgi:hypothetical protein